MKLVIDHDGVKREINGSFSVCGSAEDLRSFAAQLRGLEPGASYGWVEIRDRRPECRANQRPIHWSAGALADAAPDAAES